MGQKVTTLESYQFQIIAKTNNWPTFGGWVLRDAEPSLATCLTQIRPPLTCTITNPTPAFFPEVDGAAAAAAAAATAAAAAYAIQMD